MYKRLYALLLIIPACCFARQEVVTGVIPAPDHQHIHEGIYLEDKQVLIPWNTPYDSIKYYGDPVITMINKRRFMVSWDSVTVFKGVKASLWYVAHFAWPMSDRYRDFTNISMNFDISELEKLKPLIDEWCGKPGISRSNKYFKYQWQTKEFMINLSKYFDHGFLLIQRIVREKKPKKNKAPAH